MSLAIKRRNRRMVRARGSQAHFIRARGLWREASRYLQRRRVERAMHLLRSGRSVTDVCLNVGFTASAPSVAPSPPRRRLAVGLRPARPDRGRAHMFRDGVGEDE